MYLYKLFVWIYPYEHGDLAVSFQQTTMKKPLGTTAHTGETCPESGVWKPQGGNTTAPIAKGNTMPPYNQKAATWVLVQYA